MLTPINVFIPKVTSYWYNFSLPLDDTFYISKSKVHKNKKQVIEWTSLRTEALDFVTKPTNKNVTMT